jgi:hypothetical protein
MPKSLANPLEFYVRQSPITEPGKMAHLLADLPKDVQELCSVIQGLMVHVYWADRYGLTLSPERKQDVQLRKAASMLEKIQEMESCSLTVMRPLEKRIAGTCRDFSLLLCSFLRYQGIPARTRCGFATYFLPNHYEDHWICEYWHREMQSWVMVDPQLDPFQCDALQITFDPCKLTPGKFIPAGAAWQMCRNGRANPDSFGIFDMHGLGFVRENLVRDIASLNGMELLPWDVWGIMETEDDRLTKEDLCFLDEVASLTLQVNTGFSQLEGVYGTDARIRVPDTIVSYTNNGPIRVRIQ